LETPWTEGRETKQLHKCRLQYLFLQIMIKILHTADINGTDCPGCLEDPTIGRVKMGSSTCPCLAYHSTTRVGVATRTGVVQMHCIFRIPVSDTNSGPANENLKILNCHLPNTVKTCPHRGFEPRTAGVEPTHDPYTNGDYGRTSGTDFQEIFCLYKYSYCLNPGQMALFRGEQKTLKSL
jgi:hypothetical protein